MSLTPTALGRPGALEGRIALVTGGSRGIGRAIALAFAAEGADVAISYLSSYDRDRPNPHAAFEVGRQIEDHGRRSVVVDADVGREGDVRGLVDKTLEAFGRVDVLVNNAGFAVDGVFEAMSDETIRKQFETNVFGVMRVTRAVLPIMRAQGGGNIVQVASMGGRLAFPLYSIYHSTKWAVEGFTESLHYELRPFGIQLKLIEPGAIKTDFYGRSRLAVGGDLPDYRALVDKAERVSQAPAQNGVGADVVAAAIARAAAHRGRRMRFAVGAPAPMLLTLRRLLPDTWFFNVVRRAYGL